MAMRAREFLMRKTHASIPAQRWMKPFVPGQERGQDRPAATAGYRVEVARDWDSLATEWDRIGSVFPQPPESFAWTQTAAERLAPRAEAVAVFDRQGALAAAAVLADPGLLRHAAQPGVGALYEPTDFLYRDPAALEVLARWLAARRIPIWLRRIPAGSPTVAAVRRAYRGRGLLRLCAQGHCPYLPLDAGWTRPEDRVSANLRRDLQRARRAAERFGEVNLEVHGPRTASEFRPLFDLALSVEDRGWKGESGTSLVRDRLRYPFYRQYCEQAAAEGRLRFLFLRLGDAVAAMQLAIEYDRRLWLLKIGHDRRFDKCSPGMLLIGEGIGYAARSGLRSYEFLGTSSPWTRRWTEDERPMVSVRAYPFSVRGVLLAFMGAWRRVRRARVDQGDR